MHLDTGQNLRKNTCPRARIRTGSYTDRDGKKVYTTDVIVEDQEFAESKNSSGESRQADGNGFMAPLPDEKPPFE